MAKKIRVRLKEKSYDIVIGNFAYLKKFIGGLGKRQIVIVTDYLVGALYGKQVQGLFSGAECNMLKMPPGEKHKSLAAVAALYDKLVDLNVSRDALIIALGGGVIGDLAGFAAATYMRGVDLIQVPTTLLAMVDAAIGGKTAVNHRKGKNLIGSFYQPKLVLIDINALKTLPARELKCGLAEVLKYGIIKDKNIFEMLEGNPKVSPAFWQKLIYLCARIKADVVSKDERELKGYRMILNFGHTIGHAVEALSGYRKVNHGEAVGFGMLAASLIALKLKLIDQITYERIKKMITLLKLPVKMELGIPKIMKALKLDKKVRAGKIRFVLPVSIGKVIMRDDVPERLVGSVLKELGCK